MAFTADFMCSSFKRELLVGLHNFTLTTGNVFKMALYDNTAAFTAATTDYTSVNEVPNGSGYTTGGEALTNVTPTLDTPITTAITDFEDEVWGTATFSAYGALTYNSTAGTEAVIINDFGGVKTATAGDFTVQFPTPDGTTAIIRIA